jgi:hypothetical protein
MKIPTPDWNTYNCSIAQVATTSHCSWYTQVGNWNTDAEFLADVKVRIPVSFTTVVMFVADAY